MKSDIGFVLGLKMRSYHLCFVVACDSALKYFRLKMMSTSSSVHLLLSFFLIVFVVSLRRCEMLSLLLTFQVTF